ncbi:voltage-dependent anion channel [Cyathus striatus]|nr:voltage-dependent anion channel [Cyathus striatus]
MYPVFSACDKLTRQASPVLFAVTMGTGAISILCYNFPYGKDTKVTFVLSLAFFLLNLALFIIFTVLNAVRYFRDHDAWLRLLADPVFSMYTGCFPMAATTLINVAVDVVYRHYGLGGTGFLYFIWIVWWIDVAISVLCCWGVIHLMNTQQKHSLDTMTSAWLLPVVTLTVAASSGGVLAKALQAHSARHAMTTIFFSVFMVVVGLAIAMMIITIYLLRLIVYGLPAGSKIISSFLPLGPMAQSAFAILLIGENFQAMLPYRTGEDTSSFLSQASAGETIYILCVCIAFCLWSFATAWILFALLAMQHVMRHTKIPFQLPFWGLVFPNGVYANLTIQLASVFQFPFFRVFGTIYALITLLLCAFSPAWFTIIMGTGTVSVLVARFHFGAGSTPLKVISLSFYFLNLFLFTAFTVITALRFWMFPSLLKQTLLNPTESLFVGAFPIGAASLIDESIIIHRSWSFGGKGFLYALWSFWWLDLGISFLTAFGLLYAMMYTKHHLVAETTSVWVLPIIPLIVLSGTGGNISHDLLESSTSLASITTGFSLCAFVIGMSLTLMIITLFLTRLILHGPPKAHITPAGFIIASPLGQGGYSLLVNGEMLSKIFPFHDDYPTQGFHTMTGKIPFTLAYWGFFHFFGAIWSAIVFALWIFCFLPTVVHTWDTSIFPEASTQPTSDHEYCSSPCMRSYVDKCSGKFRNGSKRSRSI